MSALLLRLVIMIVVFGAVFLLMQFLLQRSLNRRAESRAVNRRLELIKSGLTNDQADEILRKGAPSRLRPNANFIERSYHSFRSAIQIADMRIEPHVFLMFCLAAFVVLGAVLMLLAWTSGFRITIGTIELVAGISAGFTIIVPLLYVFRRKEKRRRKMEHQFPIALDVFTRALRAGHPIPSAIDLLTKEMEDPLGSEFGMVADEVAYGADMTDALMDLADRWDMADVRMFAVSISLQNETGGNLAEILGNLSGVIRDRASMYMKVRALSSEGRMSGWMLSVLPVGTFLALFTFNRQFYFEVASDPIFVYGFTGLILLYFVGVYAIRRMIDLKV